MSSKTTKRKRATATQAQEMGTVPVEDSSRAELPAEAVAAVLAEPVSIATEVEADPVATPTAIGTVPVGDSPCVGLQSNHTVKDAAVLKNSLLQMIDEPGEVTIDAKSVERIDTAIMQLLCAFVRDRAGRGLKVRWGNPTQAVLDAARMLGVSEMLALSTAAGAAQ